MARKRAMRRVVREDPEPTPPIEPPKEEEKPKTTRKRKSSKSLATAYTKKLEEEEARKAAEHVKADESKNVYFVRCRRCARVGMFLIRKVDGLLGVNDWYTSYKEPDQDWPAKEVPCQVCKHKMPLWHNPDGTLVVNPRFMGHMPRERFDALVQEGTEV